MSAGNVSEKDGEGDKTPPQTEKVEISVCDVSSNDFKKTWLALKDLHDKELHRLQAKLTSLRKQRLADLRQPSAASKIIKLTEQQKVLNSTIQELRDQLSSKTCDRCSVNETYRNSLQQEFYDIQQRNLKFITEITTERNKLREENKKLLEKLKLTQEKFSSESDDDFIPCAQPFMSVFTVKNPEEENKVYVLEKLMEISSTEQMKSEEKKELQQSSELANPFHSQDLLDMAELSLEKISSNTSKPATVGSASQESHTFCPSFSTQCFQRGPKGQVISEDRLGQAKGEMTVTKRTSSKMFSPWSCPSIPEESNIPIPILSETSEEKMPDHRISISSSIKKKETLSNVFPLDSKLFEKRLSINIPRYNIGSLSQRGGSVLIPSNEQSTLRKNTNESTSAAQYGTEKPKSDDQSSPVGCKIKRKVKMKSKRRK